MAKISTINNSKISLSDVEKLNPLYWAQRNRMIRIGTETLAFSISRDPYFYPFLKDIYFALGVGGVKHVIIMKCRQIGCTELSINAALYAIDVFGMNVIYTLPGQQELRDFSGARFGRVVKSSPRIKDMFTSIDNLDLKVGKSASLYFRGTNSPAGLEEVPSDFVILDEVDQMIPAHADMILKSLGGSFHKQKLHLSHPTDIAHGIHALYQDSSQHEWMFNCPHCKERQDVDWHRNVDLKNCRLICAACGKEVTKQDLWNGYYVAKNPKHRIRGFHFNQLLSPTVDLEEQIIEWNNALGVPYKMKIFYNTVLGLPYAESARQLTQDDIRSLMTGESMPYYASETVMGLDVGSGLHLWVQRDNSLLRVELLQEWDELEGFISRYNPKCLVIDIGPESHKGAEVCRNLRERGIDAWLCMRSDGLKGNRIIDENTMTIKVNKTEQFDEFYSCLGEMKLPNNLPQDAINQLVAPVRTLKKKPDGSREGMWNKGISHYADAGAYALEAAKQVKLKKHIVTDFIVPSLSGESKWRGRFGEELRERPR